MEVEAHEALDDLKSLLTRIPFWFPPEDKEPLLLYVAMTTQVVSLVLVVERQEEKVNVCFSIMSTS